MKDIDATKKYLSEAYGLRFFQSKSATLAECNERYDCGPGDTGSKDATRRAHAALTLPLACAFKAPAAFKVTRTHAAGCPRLARGKHTCESEPFGRIICTL